MKQFALFLFLILTLSSCVKEDACKNVTCLNNGVCTSGKCKCPAGYSGTNCEKGNGGGQAFFYQIGDQGWGTCTVTCAGQSGIISNTFPLGSISSPSCGNAGGVTFDLAPGTYSYHLLWHNGMTYDANVTITAGTCTPVSYAAILVNITGGVSFYNTNPTFSYINVTIDGDTKIVNLLTTSGQPANCVQNGNANFDLLAGTYTYNAVASNGATASGTLNVTAGTCYTVNLH